MAAFAVMMTGCFDDRNRVFVDDSAVVRQAWRTC